jgi:hypothetical protein
MKVKPSVKRICEKCKTIRRHGPHGPFSADEVDHHVTKSYHGSEALQLHGLQREKIPVVAALRRIGVVIRALEEGSGTPIVAG